MAKSPLTVSMSSIMARLVAGDLYCDIEIKRHTTTFDKVKSKSTITTTTIPARGVLGESVEFTNASGVLEKATTLIANQPLVIGDEVVMAGRKFTVLSVDDIAPHGTSLLWKCAVR